MRIDEVGLREILLAPETGVFEQLLGLNTSTGSIKGVHVMNDLAQCVLGGVPGYGGDRICRVIRHDKADAAEDNTEGALRADRDMGAWFDAAYPPELGPDTSRLREAAAILFNLDGGVYRAGDSMASGLATHRDLLGAEGFRRFGVGRYIERILGEPGRARLRELFLDARDPYTRALGPMRDRSPNREARPPRPTSSALSPFDEALGQRLTVLLGQPLTKPVLLRYLLLTSTLGIALKLLGAGRRDGRPIVLACADDPSGERPVRREAVQSWARGVASFYDRVASELAQHPRAQQLAPAPKAPALDVPGALDVATGARAIVEAARAPAASKRLNMYWPEEFVVALGRRAGCVRPKADQAGWGKHLALTSDLVEALILTSVPAGAPPAAWSDVWERVRADLGLVIGAGEYEDALFLQQGGVNHVDLGDLTRNADLVLAQTTARGVARRLPDSGAEVGGSLQ